MSKVGSLGLGMCVLLVGCSQPSYDDCVLDSVRLGSNELAIETAKEVCQRQTEIAKKEALSVIVSREIRPYADGSRRIYVEVSNDTTDIVTLVDVKISSDNEMRYDTWIEPDRWVELELPTGEDAVPSELKVGDVLEASSVKVIPSK